MKRFLFLCAVFLTFGKISAQDDVQLTQFYNNEMFYNPAAAGFSGDFMASLTYRAQWAGTRAVRDAMPQYMLLNVEQLMKDWRSGIGLTVYNVSQHVQNNLLIKGSYNYHVQLDDQTFLAMGINMGFMSRGINDGVLAGEGTLINQRYGNLSDLGLGVKFYMPELQVGAAVQHIPGVILGEEKARKHPHFYYYMIYNHVIDYDWKLMPHVFLKNSAGFSTNVDIGFRVGFRDIVQVGAAWRRDAIGLLFGIDLAEQFHIGYSFDIHMGNKAMSTTGIRPSHEIVLRYRTEPFFGGGSYSYDW